MSSLTISLLQADLSWENKQSNLEKFSSGINELSSNTELVLLPEMFSTGFSMNAPALAETMEGETIAWMKAISKKKNIALAGSIIVKEKDKFYNRLIYVLPSGHVGTYDKRHLFSFGGEDKHYNSGDKRLIASLKGWKINFQICYDLRFPVWARQQVKNTEPEYDLLVYVANWPQRRIHAWKSLLVARAVENQCYVIGVNRIGGDGHGIYHDGNSMIVDPLGEILYCGEDKEVTQSTTLHKKDLEDVREKFRFLRDADGFNISV